MSNNYMKNRQIGKNWYWLAMSLFMVSAEVISQATEDTATSSHGNKRDLLINNSTLDRLSTNLAITYIEKDGLVSIEAENFASQTLSDKRRWIVFSSKSKLDTAEHQFADADLPHYKNASNEAYIEILPDTRTNHQEALIKGENFSNEPGQVAILSYPVYFSQPGRYYIWARAFSTGSEDNGVHFGINGQWPQSAQRLQLCKGKHKWTWSSQQRRKDNHCGTPQTMWLDVPAPGQQLVTVSMREDGFELDKFILTLDENFQPQGYGAEPTIYSPSPLAVKTKYKKIKQYSLILDAAEYFETSGDSPAPFYHDKQRDVLAINAANTEARNVYVRADYVIEEKRKGSRLVKDKPYQASLVTLGEIDGESNYRVLLNGELIGEFINSETDIDYQEMYFDLGELSLQAGDKLSVESMAVTNGKIPENDGTAFARGRWRGIVLH